MEKHDIQVDEYLVWNGLKLKSWNYGEYEGPQTNPDSLKKEQMYMYAVYIYINYIYLWNLFALYFGVWTIQNKVFSNQNKGHQRVPGTWTAWIY